MHSILKTAKEHGPISLKRPKTDCVEYKAQAYDLLKASLKPEALEHVDFEMLLMLSAAMRVGREEFLSRRLTRAKPRLAHLNSARSLRLEAPR